MISSLDKAAGILGTLSSLEWIGPKSDGTPFVLIAFHRSAVKELSRQMEIAGIEYFSMTQEDSIEQREAKKTAFQNGERQAFITTYGVGGTGLNLTRASKLCLVNLPWIEGAVSQAISRTWRAGQKSACTTVVLLQAGSIDESTYYLIKNKGRANFKTAGVDQMRRQGGKLPGWAIGSILDFEQTDTIKADTSGEDTDPNKDNEPINKTGWLS
jgi:superfamily II DNA or RNA helicase